MNTQAVLFVAYYHVKYARGILCYGYSMLMLVPVISCVNLHAMFISNLDSKALFHFKYK